jgi:hypothetical protein
METYTGHLDRFALVGRNIFKPTLLSSGINIKPSLLGPLDPRSGDRD